MKRRYYPGRWVWESRNGGGTQKGFFGALRKRRFGKVWEVKDEGIGVMKGEDEAEVGFDGVWL